MGSGKWTSNAFYSYSTDKNYHTATAASQIYQQQHMSPLLNPKGVVRESRDSADNPESNAIIIGLDVTGSMSSVLLDLAKHGLNAIVTGIYDRKPVTDPHVLCMAVGDAEWDSAPLQVTQFEADIRIAQQLELLYLEQGGGGNHYESYILPWFFAAQQTKIDCFEKRGKKGYLFTIGDEEPTPKLSRHLIQAITGISSSHDYSAHQLLTLVSQQWEVFHVIIGQGSYATSAPKAVKEKWAALLGQKAIWLDDYTKLAQVIVSTMQAWEGVSHDAIVASWDTTTGAVVGAAVAHIHRGIAIGGVL